MSCITWYPLKNTLGIEPILDIRCKFFFQIQVHKVLKTTERRKLVDFSSLCIPKNKRCGFLYAKIKQEKKMINNVGSIINHVSCMVNIHEK